MRTSHAVRTTFFLSWGCILTCYLDSAIRADLEKSGVYMTGLSQCGCTCSYTADAMVTSHALLACGPRKIAHMDPKRAHEGRAISSSRAFCE